MSSRPEAGGPPRMPKPFTTDELAQMRADIADRRSPDAYRAGRWSVSPLNRDPQVIGRFAGNPRFRDTTVKSLATKPGVFATRPDMVEYLRQLAAAGVGEIVTPGPSGRPADEIRDDIAVIKEQNEECLTVCPFVGTPAESELAREVGYDAVQVPSPAFGPAALIYESGIYTMSWHGEDWRASITERQNREFLANAKAAVASARELGLRVIATIEMVSYLNAETLPETVAELASAGCHEITLFDGPGAVGPEATAQLVTQTLSTAPDVEVGVHAHNSFGLAVACCVAAVRAGANVVELSVNGYCGGPGNADLAATALAFEALYGVSTGIRIDRLTELARYGERMTGQQLASNQPITGTEAFGWGGRDWILQEREVDPLLHNCVEPAAVGNQRYVPLTPQSGVFVLAAKLAELGVVVEHSDVPEVLERCHDEMRTRRRLLTDDEIGSIAERHTSGMR